MILHVPGLMPVCLCLSVPVSVPVPAYVSVSAISVLALSLSLAVSQACEYSFLSISHNQCSCLLRPDIRAVMRSLSVTGRRGGALQCWGALHRRRAAGDRGSDPRLSNTNKLSLSIPPLGIPTYVPERWSAYACCSVLRYLGHDGFPNLTPTN